MPAGVQPRRVARWAESDMACLATSRAAVSNCSMAVLEMLNWAAPMEANPLSGKTAATSGSKFGVTPPSKKRSLTLFRYCGTVRRRSPAGAGTNDWEGVPPPPTPPVAIAPVDEPAVDEFPLDSPMELAPQLAELLPPP